MGFLIWMFAAILLWALARLFIWVRPHDGWTPNVGLALLGGVLGGFVFDLGLRGDSAMNFRGPTLIGAVVGTLALLIVSLVFARTPAAPRIG